MDSLSEHILVTGGGGFIGSHLVDLMIDLSVRIEYTEIASSMQKRK